MRLRLSMGPNILAVDSQQRAARMRPLRRLLMPLGSLAVFGLVICPPLAAKQDYCVTCTGPSASYVCAIEGLSESAAARIQGQVLCIKQLATEGRHEQCKIDRTATAVCQGLLKTVHPPAEDQPAAAPPSSPARPASAPAIQPAPDVARPGAQSAPKPDASAHVTANTAPAKPDTRSGLQKAGDSIGTAVSKSWSCVTSLFSDC